MIIVLLIVFGIIHAIIADYKGFNPLLWFFAGGSLIGLIVILILPSAKKAEKENPEKSQEIKTSANIAGAIFLVISVISILSFYEDSLGKNEQIQLLEIAENPLKSRQN